MLYVENLFASYGGSLILQGVNFRIAQGEIMALMGRNGMGKTTFMRALMGLLRSSEGQIVFNGKSIHDRQTHNIAADGIGYVPQGREIFGDFSVKDNLLLGMLKFDRKNRLVPKEIFEYFPILDERRDQRAGSLSGGEQQMLAIARALSGRPKLLLLDEPSEGIQPSIVDEISQILLKINSETELTVLIVEQNVNMVMEIADSFSFMENGTIVHHCSVQDVKENESIITKYITV
jgi:urea ABC transporter ATP-binding protein UrtE